MKIAPIYDDSEGHADIASKFDQTLQTAILARYIAGQTTWIEVSVETHTGLRCSSNFSNSVFFQLPPEKS